MFSGNLPIAAVRYLTLDAEKQILSVKEAGK
jgi:hypothetical protein